MTQNPIFVLGATRLVVGLSSILKVTAEAYQQAHALKIIAGSGTLEIVQGTSTGGSGWGAGYPVGASEVVNIGGPATFYLAATGATMTAGLLMGRTAGATVI